MAPKVCSVDGCGRQQTCKGLCDGHYQQQRVGKPLVPLQVRHAQCTFKGCGLPHEAKGLCEAHYTQARKGGRIKPLDYTPSPIGPDGSVVLFGARDRTKGCQVGIAFVDEDSRPVVREHRWRLNANGYAVTKIEGTSTYMHRLLMPEAGKFEVDHIDGNRLNNRKANLRVVTKKEQMQNRGVRADNKTGHRNVHYDAKKKLYRVCVRLSDGRALGHRHKLIEDAIAEAAALRAEHMPFSVESRSRREP